MPPDATPAAPATTQAAPPPAPPATPPAAPDPNPPAPKDPPKARDLLAEEPKTEKEPAAGDQGKPATPPSDDYKITVPEGLVLDPAMLEAVTPLLKEFGVKPEQASKLATVVGELGQKQQEAANARWVEQTGKWVEAVQNDKEVGGADWQKKVDVAVRAGMVFGGEDFKKFLAEFPGIGNHPALVKMLFRVGSRVREGSIGSGTGAKPGDQLDDGLRSLYDKSPELFDKE